jgi:hypothetical protein
LFSGNGFRPTCHQLPYDWRRVDGSKTRQRLGKLVECRVSWQIDRPQCAGDDEPHRPRRAEFWRRVETGKKRIEELCRTGDGTSARSDGAFNEHPARWRQSDNVRGRNARCLIACHLQRKLANDRDSFKRPEAHSGCRQIS